MRATHPEPRSEPRELLEAGRLKEALVAAREQAAADPADPEPLYLQAVAERYLGRNEEALATVARLKALAPRHARAHQEEGHLHKALGNLARAGAAYRRAVELNRALIASWRELAGIEARLGHREAQLVAQAEYRRLAELPPELLTVTSLIQEGKLYQAERLCRDFLKKRPHHVEAMRLLARLGLKLFIYDDAEFLLESCVEFEPNNWLARRDYVEVLHKRQKFEQALAQAEVLRKRFPGSAPFELAYANECVAVGKFQTALDIYDRVLAGNAKLVQARVAHGHVLKTIGRVDEAVESYRSAYRVCRDFGDAYWSLANLKTYRFTDDEIAAMQEHADNPATETADRFHLCFALGKALEDRGEFERSFARYEQGNRLRREGLRYDPDRAEAAMRAQAAVCTPELFERFAGAGAPHPDPIFIVGLPRSGSTLLEQILASHSQVDGTMELPNVLALAHRLNGRRMLADEARYPGVLAEMAPEQLRKFGDAYIEGTRYQRAGAPRFIDKMPNNFLHVGLIHLMLPNAKIIDARRHPMACCFSNYKQLFADGQEFTYELSEIARYYRGYAALIEHWDRTLPGQVLRVHYEEIVTDLKGQVQRILDFLQLPFEAGCLEFHRLDRSVRTPSSEQVRRPIYREGLQQWRRYERWLDPLRDGLGQLAL